MGRRRGDAGPHGLAVVDKEPGWTSHDVVAKARGLLGTRKVGHSGTLDPDATGVLLLGVGVVTRLLRFLSIPPKRYTATVVLGTATSTLDASGEVTGTWDMGHVTIDDVRHVAAGLTGEIRQVPPMVSAVKVGGRRLHELAREGIEVEREARPVTVHRFEVGEPLAPGELPIEVQCSSGTYVRTLAADLGAALGGGAHLRDLRRTEIGCFHERDAVPIAALTPEHLLSPAEALGWMQRSPVEADVATLVRHGRVLHRDVLQPTEDGPLAVLGPDLELLAVYEPHKDDTMKPAVVLPPVEPRR